ncbi:hypothetical protein LOK49_LG04G00739 [Camellia lanceoleosa]|uniref:Uncharacterized protein n=1 Tax=Camellia lanceoleosa TaxID=1840588 RepID=A0ACC0I475_9ERIC|nr:hypothetical protein LOK49_LG04G00739 [Camellia lanceoleosa]
MEIEVAAYARIEEVNKTSIIVDASKYIEQLKRKVERLSQDVASSQSSNGQNSLPMQVTVETLEKGFLINVFSEKKCPGLLVTILKAFEELGLDVLDANVSCSENFRLEAVGGEVSRFMDLIVNSLYSNNDALDKLRFLSVIDSNLLKGGVDLDIRIQTNKDNGIITIMDSSIGMTRQELIDCLGTIAQSGIAKFLKALKVHQYLA